MAIIKGISVILYEHEDPEESGSDSGGVVPTVDPFGKETYPEVPVQIDNVLVAPATSQEILDATNLYGKKAVYTLAIPKEDEHEWRDRRVFFFGQDWHTFGIPLKGIECDIPLDWNMMVTVEKYE